MELHELLEEDEVTTKVATFRQIDQRECTQRSQKSRVSGKGNEHHNHMELSHYHEHVQIRWKAKSPSKFIFRLVTAFSFTTN